MLRQEQNKTSPVKLQAVLKRNLGYSKLKAVSDASNRCDVQMPQGDTCQSRSSSALTATADVEGTIYGEKKGTNLKY